MIRQTVTGSGRLSPERYLYNYLIEGFPFEQCIVPARANLDVLCSNRRTVQAESILMGETLREMAFCNFFGSVDEQYDVVIIDVSPSINLLQTCAMVYTRRILVPVAMDPLSFQGARASIETANSLNQLLKTDIRAVAILPVMVHRRMVMTEMVLSGLEDLSQQTGIPLLPSIRTDATVPKAARQKQFLADFDSNCKAYQDYRVAADALTTILQGELRDRETAARA
jgi:chromosome partitioning protein